MLSLFFNKIDLDLLISWSKVVPEDYKKYFGVLCCLANNGRPSYASDSVIFGSRKNSELIKSYNNTYEL